jgi:site-specific recombinase XerD
MDESVRSRFLAYLECLDSGGREQVIGYLRVIEARSYAPDTLRCAATALKLFVSSLPEERRALLSRDLSLSEPRDIDSFIEAERARGLSPSTINGRVSQLREFFHFLIEEGAMSRHPVSRRRHHLAVPETLPRPVPDSDLVRFFKAVDSVRDRLIFLFMLRCGLRVSEACALAWDDVELPSLSVRVNGGKGDVDRVAYLAPDVEQSLRLWQTHRGASPWLFPSRKVAGTHIGRRNVYVMMRKYLADAGLDRRYSPHCLRHTFATHLLNAGVTLEVLKELMGHRSIRMTLRYTQLYDETKRRQYTEAMERITRQAAGGR